MKKLLTLSLVLGLAVIGAYAVESQIWGQMRVLNIFGYGQEESLKLGPLFTMLQKEYFVKIFLAILVLVPAAFLTHYMIIGPKVFPHDGKKIQAFSLYNRVIHQVAAVSFIVIVPTGFVIVFGDFFGGGMFVRLCKNLHGIFTIPFAIVVIPMFLMWLKEAIFNFDDVKWMMIVGGYLSKEKKPIPAGKFNAGQKMWYWIATLGGMVMVITGAAMFFMDFNIDMVKSMTGLSQIDLLRVMAILHNVVGFLVVALFITQFLCLCFLFKVLFQGF